MNVSVSIIIPAFNAEKFIEKCVNSILNQTYVNLEAIIVNDGSTDNTLSLLRELEGNDKRVRIIDKKNEGVSAARNNGINAALGDYLVFVDADDYLAPDYVEYMLSLVERTGAEFCVSKNCFTKKDELQIENEEIRLLIPEDAVALLLSPKVIVGCWNKIYKTEFIKRNAMEFSTTLFYGEGLFFIISIAQLAHCVGVGNRKVYYYRRNNEASATTKFNIEKMRNGEKALREIKENIKLESKKIDNMWKLHMSLFSLGAITRMKTNYVDKIYKEDYRHWKKILSSNLWSLIVSNDVSMYRKLMLICGASFPGLLAKMDVLRRKKISNKSVS